MPQYQQWQIWEVRFPFVENDGRYKERPALLLTTQAEFKANGKLRFAYITTEDHPKTKYRIELFPAHPDLRSHPDKKFDPCWIHCEQTAVLTHAGVIDYWGMLAGDLKQEAMEIYDLLGPTGNIPPAPQ